MMQSLCVRKRIIGIKESFSLIPMILFLTLSYRDLLDSIVPLKHILTVLIAGSDHTWKLEFVGEVSVVKRMPVGKQFSLLVREAG
jgi:hypothetical protein